jgi:hypothetical protein
MPSLRSLLLTAPLLLALPSAMAVAGEKIVVKASSDVQITIIYTQALGVESPPVISVIIAPDRRRIIRHNRFGGFRNQFSGPKYPF